MSFLNVCHTKALRAIMYFNEASYLRRVVKGARGLEVFSAPFRQEWSDLLVNLKLGRARQVHGLKKKNCNENFCLTMILDGHKVEKS